MQSSSVFQLKPASPFSDSDHDTEETKHSTDKRVIQMLDLLQDTEDTLCRLNNLRQKQKQVKSRSTKRTIPCVYLYTSSPNVLPESLPYLPLKEKEDIKSYVQALPRISSFQWPEVPACSSVSCFEESLYAILKQLMMHQNKGVSLDSDISALTTLFKSLIESNVASFVLSFRCILRWCCDMSDVWQSQMFFTCLFQAMCASTIARPEYLPHWKTLHDVIVNNYNTELYEESSNELSAFVFDHWIRMLFREMKPEKSLECFMSMWSIKQDLHWLHIEPYVLRDIRDDENKVGEEEEEENTEKDKDKWLILHLHQKKKEIQSVLDHLTVSIAQLELP